MIMIKKYLLPDSRDIKTEFVVKKGIRWTVIQYDIIQLSLDLNI